MDCFVASDVCETLLHEVDLFKLFWIVVLRSWLSYERTKEFEHMVHEVVHDQGAAHEDKEGSHSGGNTHDQIQQENEATHHDNQARQTASPSSQKNKSKPQ